MYKVSKILNTKPVSYRLRDSNDKGILSGFCDYKLQKFKKNSEIYQIEEILKSRTHWSKR